MPSIRSLRPHLRPWFSLWIPLVLLAELPVLSSWLENRYQVSGPDIYLPLTLGFLAASLVAVIFYKPYKQRPLGAYLAGIITVLIIGEKYVTKLDTVSPIIRSFNPIPNLKTWEGLVFGLFFLILVLLFSRWLGYAVDTLFAKHKWETKDLLGGITVVIAVTFALQAYPVVRIMAIESPQFSYRPPALSTQGKPLPKDAAKPDIYYIVLDRYTSQHVLKEQFGYDNSPFINFLTDKGYVTTPDSHQNYPYTTMSIASTLNANYHTDLVQKFAGSSEQTLTPYHESIQYSSVIQRLKGLGYSYSELGSWYEASNKAPLADHYYQPEGQLTVFGRTFALNTFPKNMLTQSPFWRLVERGVSVGGFDLLSYHGIGEADATVYKLNTLKDIAAGPSGGRFVFAHILTPHDPYYFNADGSLNTSTGNDNMGMPIKEKYVNQVKYINREMESILTDIDKNSDGKAVVILQSDEGPYPMQLNDQNFNGSSVEEEIANGSMLDWSDNDLLMKFGNLAAYHIPQASAQDLAAGADNVNVFRLVLNTYFGDGLSYLPRCYYGYVNGRSQPFVYSDITKRLTGSSNSQCPANSDFK